MQKYLYRPLDKERQEIRLISLVGGQFDDTLRISIHHYAFPSISHDNEKILVAGELQPNLPFPWEARETIDGRVIFQNRHTNQTSWTHPISNAEVSAAQRPADRPQYDALSYTWGNEENAETIQVIEYESGEHCAELRGYQNLALALRHLRYSDRTRTMWVDSICINQEDILERNEQVTRMASIYKLATHVVVWLGVEESNSCHAIEVLQHIADQIVLTKSGSLIRSPEAEFPNVWMNACCFTFDNRTWAALHTFVERAWFYRLWCWQEVNLGSRNALMQCGETVIPWSTLERAILCLHNKEFLPSAEFRERCRHIALLYANSDSWSMSGMLDISRSKGCKDPRDKIYGLLGLTAPRFTSMITIDYSLPVEQIFKMTFLAHADCTKRLELLKHCGLADRTTEGPSWVPDWSKTDFTPPILSEQVSTGLSRAHFKYLAPNILEVVGVECCSIQSVSDIAPRDIDKVLQTVRVWFNDLPKEDVYLNGQKMIEAFALTIGMNRTGHRHPTNHFLSVYGFVDLLQQILLMDENSMENPIYSDREVVNIVQKCKGRAFFTTEDGHIGTTVGGVETGKRIRD